MTKEKILEERDSICSGKKNDEERKQLYFELLRKVADSLPDKLPERWLAVYDIEEDNKREFCQLLDTESKLLLRIKDCWCATTKEVEAEIARLKREEKPEYKAILSECTPPDYHIVDSNHRVMASGVVPEFKDRILKAFNNPEVKE